MKKTLLSILGLVAGIGLNAQVIFNVKAPSPAGLLGNYPLSYALPANSWGVGDLMDPAESVTGMLAIVDDGTAGDSLGCNALVNGGSISGKIAVIYRGSCSFGIKALNAQNAGAIGIIIVNNVNGLINMLGGTEGMSVTVPTINIGKETGELLKTALDAGSITAFIGNKAGAFPVDLAFKETWVQYPQQASRPAALSTLPGEYVVEPGLWVYNIGSADQTGVTVNATIRRGSTVLSSENKPGLDILKGDSVYVSFASYGASWTAGDHSLTYTITPLSTDGDAGDNVKATDFNISTSAIAYAPLNYAGLPIANYFVKTTAAAPVFYCTNFRDPNADNLNLTGFSFATTPLAPHLLTNEYLEIEMYEWNDAFVDLNTAATFDDLTSVAFVEYTYPSNLRDSTIYVPYDEAVYTFKPNQRYLTCVRVLTDSLYFGFTDHVDYNANIEKYLQPISIIKSGGTWYSAGFGSSTTAAIGVHTVPNGSGISSNKINTDVVPFPTPSNQYVNIPFVSNGAKSATINVTDVTGKLVTTTTGTIEGKNLRVNTTQLSNGTYLFNVTLDNGVSSSFRVLVGR